MPISFNVQYRVRIYTYEFVGVLCFVCVCVAVSTAAYFVVSSFRQTNETNKRRQKKKVKPCTLCDAFRLRTGTLRLADWLTKLNSSDYGKRTLHFASHSSHRHRRRRCRHRCRHRCRRHHDTILSLRLCVCPPKKTAQRSLCAQFTCDRRSEQTYFFIYSLSQLCFNVFFFSFTSFVCKLKSL